MIHCTITQGLFPLLHRFINEILDRLCFQRLQTLLILRTLIVESLKRFSFSLPLLAEFHELLVQRLDTLVRRRPLISHFITNAIDRRGQGSLHVTQTFILRFSLSCRTGCKVSTEIMNHCVEACMNVCESGLYPELEGIAKLLTVWVDIGDVMFLVKDIHLLAFIVKRSLIVVHFGTMTSSELEFGSLGSSTRASSAGIKSLFIESSTRDAR